VPRKRESSACTAVSASKQLARFGTLEPNQNALCSRVSAYPTSYSKLGYPPSHTNRRPADAASLQTNNLADQTAIVFKV
jgi:hypothetical protein